MKTLIATLAATTVASSATAGVTSYSDLASWATAAAALSGEYTDPGTFSNGVQVNSTTVNAGFGWESFTASIIGGTITVDTTANTLAVAVGSGGSATLTFTFNGFGLPPYTSGGNGIWGFALNFSSLSNGNVGMEANLVPVNGVGPYTNFIGAIINTTNVPAGTAIAPMTSFSLNFAANTTATINGSTYAIIPAPGALALLGAAGLVGGRRRRG